jgi:hypothetical protein
MNIGAALMLTAVFGVTNALASGLTPKSLKAVQIAADSSVWSARVDKKDSTGDSDYVIRHKKLERCEITVLEMWGKPSVHKEEWDTYASAFKRAGQSFAEVSRPAKLNAPAAPFECNAFEGSMKEKIAPTTTLYCSASKAQPAGSFNIIVDLPKVDAEREACMKDANAAIATISVK